MGSESVDGGWGQVCRNRTDAEREGDNDLLQRLLHHKAGPHPPAQRGFSPSREDSWHLLKSYGAEWRLVVHHGMWTSTWSGSLKTVPILALPLTRPKGGDLFLR